MVPSLWCILTLKSHLEPHANTKSMGNRFEILVQAYDELASPENFCHNVSHGNFQTNWETFEHDAEKSYAPWLIVNNKESSS